MATSGDELVAHRQKLAQLAHTIVVKVGSRVLTTEAGRLNVDRVSSLAQEISRVLATGRKLVLVSSGAVASGMGQLGLAKRPGDLPQLQAVAAVGQCHLVQAYDQALAASGHPAAQLLLTADDLNHRTKYLNVRNTLRVLLELGAVPIINENDTVSVDELQTTFGDNDRLAALVTNLLRAPLLVLLSDVDGLFDGDPALRESKRMPVLKQIDSKVLGLVKDSTGGISKGGMASKLNAAKLCMRSGEHVIITSGRVPGMLDRILAGDDVGTLCLPQTASVTSRKRWIGYTVPPKGQLLLDAGACRAIGQQGRSLLAIGITGVLGSFQKGDVVGLCDDQGREIARGLTNYQADELRRIRGLRTEEVARVLGRRPYDEVVHRDNMMLTAD